jgi:hypothetical protein
MLQTMRKMALTRTYGIKFRITLLENGKLIVRYLLRWIDTSVDYPVSRVQSEQTLQRVYHNSAVREGKNLSLDESIL